MFRFSGINDYDSKMCIHIQSYILFCYLITGSTCLQCKIEWFHYECVGIIARPKGKWYCPECAPRMKQRKRAQSLWVDLQCQWIWIYTHEIKDIQPGPHNLDSSIYVYEQHLVYFFHHECGKKDLHLYYTLCTFNGLW